MKRLLIIIINLSFILLLVTACTESEEFVVDTPSGTLDAITNVKLVENVNGSLVTVDTDYLKRKWENESLVEGYQVTFKEFEIVKSTDKDSKKEYFFLKAISTDGTIQTGAFLEMLSEDEALIGKKKCTCKGCTQGCNLSVNGNWCSCSSCLNDGKCEKTEEQTIEP